MINEGQTQNYECGLPNGCTTIQGYKRLSISLTKEVKLRSKQIAWLCKKLEELERVLRPENKEACWHYNWREASLKHAQEDQ